MDREDQAKLKVLLQSIEKAVPAGGLYRTTRSLRLRKDLWALEWSETERTYSPRVYMMLGVVVVSEPMVYRVNGVRLAVNLFCPGSGVCYHFEAVDALEDTCWLANQLIEWFEPVKE